MYRIPSNDTLHSNMHQYQHTSCSPKADMPPFHLFNQHQRKTMSHVIIVVHRIPCSDLLECKNAQIQTYKLFIESQHDTVLYSTNINISIDPDIIVIVVYLNNKRVNVSWCIIRQIMTHPNQNMHKYQHTSCSSEFNTIPFRILNPHPCRAVSLSLKLNRRRVCN